MPPEAGVLLVRIFLLRQGAVWEITVIAVFRQGVISIRVFRLVVIRLQFRRCFWSFFAAASCLPGTSAPCAFGGGGFLCGDCHLPQQSILLHSLQLHKIYRVAFRQPVHGMQNMGQLYGGVFAVLSSFPGAGHHEDKTL